jgi:multidrug efflux pump subunit AcrB
MKSLFSFLTRLSLRFRVVTLILVGAASLLGIVAITQLKQELIPPVEFPQTIILAQVSGMTSEQVLTIMTSRLETELDQIEAIVNIESTTTGAFGSVITAANEFGLNQARLRSDIQDAINRVWLPLRRIQPGDGQDTQAFADTLLGDMTPDMLIYVAESDPNFLFQLAPEVWASLSDDTARAVLAYLASQTQGSDSTHSALHQLVDQEIVPELEALEVVANVSVSGGQALPGDESGLAAHMPFEEAPESTSLLFQLTPEVWAVVSAKAGLGALDNIVVETLAADAVTIPETAPMLPESWQMDHFETAQDLLEMRSLTKTVGSVINSFRDTGRIVGALGQTNDLTPEIVTQMLEIEPSMVQYFEADHLAAMSPEVFAVLPEEFIAGLDGFTRDELAAAALAESITGTTASQAPVDLPTAWRISLPQLITFSFDDLPLATFSVFSTGNENGEQIADSQPNSSPAEEPVVEPVNAAPTSVPSSDIPEGPPLPGLFGLMGSALGGEIELDTADDLIPLHLPAAMAEQLGADTMRAADFLNLMAQFDAAALSGGDTSATANFDMTDLLSNLSAFSECNINPLSLASGNFDIKPIIGCISPEAIAFIAEHDDTFLSSLSSAVYDAFTDATLALPNVTPPLSEVWSTLADQPEFADSPLHNTDDVLAFGDGEASRVLNTINETVPEAFSGYEVRLFDSLSSGVIRHFVIQEPDFWANLDDDVLLKLSPAALSLIPSETLDSIADDEETAATLSAVASGEQPSAAAALASRYVSDVPPADPTAPPLNQEWQFIATFIPGTELNNAFDFLRFPDQFGTPATFWNGFFNSPGGASFAPGLFGGITVDVMNYIAERDENFLTDLTPNVLQLLPADVLATLPEDVQAHAQDGGESFQATATVTRTNSAPSLSVTIFKVSDANTVEAYHVVEEALREIDAQNDDISVVVAFEQSSFIEESISGVAREGGLGAIFAIIIILLFLSNGLWRRSARRLVGAIMVGVFLILLVFLVVTGLDAANGDVNLALAQVDVVVRVLLILGVVAGLLILLWPGSLPYPAWRSTLVTAISIPLSVLIALALMRWLPPAVNGLLAPSAEGSPILSFLLRMFPASITLNIMTLSGLTVAIGRVVDDSIVVLENIYRHIQEGGDKREAIITGTRDVSVAIFAATVITVVVFLPLGLTGGLISEFFLPFGLAVTYALMASFIVAITVVPVMAYLFIHPDETEHSHHSWMERTYLPALQWALGSRRNRTVVLAVAFASMLFGGILFATRPTTFLPGFGEPQITVAVELPAGTNIIETNEKVARLEQFIRTSIPTDELSTIQTIVGGGGASIETLLGIGGSVSENIANLTIAIHSQETLDARAQEIRAEAEAIFGEDNVTVSAASLSDQGFGGFDLVVSGPQEDLIAIDPVIIETLNGIEGITNATSTLAQIGGASTDEDTPTTYLRVNREIAIEYSAELETENTLGVTSQAIEAIKALPELPDTVSVSQGFNSELQTQGFANLFVAMGIAIAIVVVILIITFGSVVHWLDIILSIIVAPVGAAVALTLTNRVLGISAMIGMLMLIGIVVTNAVVLIDRVQANRRERHMNVHDALIEAGGRRLRPILMTALATIIALIPLAVGLSEGAIIASELGTVVIGGLFSSTILTLIVVPVAYSLLHPLHERVARLFGSRS